MPSKSKPTLLGGHTRYEICTRLGLNFKTTTLSLPSREQALMWVVKNQIARRNLTPTQRAALAVDFDRELVKETKARRKKSNKNKENGKGENFPPSPEEDEEGKSRDRAAKAYGASPRYVTDAKQIEAEAARRVPHGRATRC
jgi:hypothetical protein